MILHAGCGPCYIDGMFNVDVRTEYKTDYCGNIFDLTNPECKSYIAPNSVEMIWSCHMLEHLEYPHYVVSCLKAFHSWLIPDGLLRLAVPDLELIIKYYTEKDEKLLLLYGSQMDYAFYKPKSMAERVNFFVKGWEHKIAFDYTLLHELLDDAGFKNIEKMEPYVSRWLGDWEYDRMEIETLFVEAEK